MALRVAPVRFVLQKNKCFIDDVHQCKWWSVAGSDFEVRVTRLAYKQFLCGGLLVDLSVAIQVAPVRFVLQQAKDSFLSRTTYFGATGGLLVFPI